ncbi:MAG: cytochrome P450 [Chloroflexi bacterium]|nr:cytochrome P450 [Chloroflexota bacterium]
MNRPVGVRGLAGAAQITELREVRAAAKDWTSFSSRVMGDPDVRDYPQLPLEVDPPEHGAFRALLGPFLGRQAVESLEPAIRSIADGLVSEFAARGRAEAVHDLAIPMVATTIAHVLGRPGDAAEIRSWGMTSWEVRPDGTRSGARLHEYVVRVLDEGARAPGDDAFSRFAAAQVDGRPLTRREQVGLASLVLAGGRDTVIHTLCGAVWHLAGDATARTRLRGESQRLPLAIEEYLRYFSPNPGMERRATTEVRGNWGRAGDGDIVILGWGPANHDPAAFDAPGEIRLDRRPNPHLAFGSGPHTCIGIHLARLEVLCFMEALLAVVPDWRLGEGVVLESLPLAADDVPMRFETLPLEVC